ncbi:hypothetical protein ACJ5NV_12280 [Loktanella agnita]|uniref:hypothetical protein n=1 Tax=Loktanella agnita TaxID=287097 RepID=UPI003986A38D
MKRLLAVAAIALTASQAAAVEYPTFTVDAAASSVSVTSASCLPRCGITPIINPALSDVSFSLDPSGAGSREQIRNFVIWSANGSSIGEYDVSLDIVFSAPDSVTGGTGGAATFVSFMGKVISGAVQWSKDWQTVSFAQGSEIKVRMDGLEWLDHNGTLGSALQIKAANLVPMTTPSPVPLPASLPIMAVVLMLGGMVARRRGGESLGLSA